MRIDVISLIDVCNYGSMLQAYATKVAFKKENCDIRFINYCRDVNRDENLLNYWCGHNFVKKVILYPTVKKWKKTFGDFRKNELGVQGKILTEERDFENYNYDADAFCTGSDQVWNSDWNSGILLPLYLSFVPGSKYKFSFSSSFGKESISQREISKTISYLKEYKRLSVRETQAVKILNELYGIGNVVSLIDPTLALSCDEWRRVEIVPERKEKDYILIYNLNRSKEFDNYAKKLSKVSGLKLVRLCTRYDQFYRPGKSIFIPDVFEFVGLFDKAAYVLTDSFHGICFSLNMGVEPICVPPPRFEGRIANLLNLTGCRERMIRDFNDFNVLKRNVNFSLVAEKLSAERMKIYQYIRDVLNDINSLNL